MQEEVQRQEEEEETRRPHLSELNVPPRSSKRAI